MRGSFQNRGSEGTIIDGSSESNVVVVEIPVDLESTMTGKAPEPYDLLSFTSYCKTVLCEENLKFLMYVRNTFKTAGDAAEYETYMIYLIETFIQPSAPFALNLSDALLKSLLQTYEKKIDDAKVLFMYLDQPHLLLQESGELDLEFFDETSDVIYKYVEDAFSRYRKLQQKLKDVDALVCARNDKLAREHQYAARKAALWWREKITLKEFFSFPDPGENLIGSGNEFIH